jgi:hypothetical protein
MLAHINILVGLDHHSRRCGRPGIPSDGKVEGIWSGFRFPGRNDGLQA